MFFDFDVMPCGECCGGQQTKCYDDCGDEHHKVYREYIKGVVKANDGVGCQDAVSRPFDELAVIRSLF